MYTLFGGWTVCKSKFELYQWNSVYVCLKKYLTANKASQVSLSFDIEQFKLSQMSEYKLTSGNYNICQFVESPEQAMANRSKLVYV